MNRILAPSLALSLLAVTSTASANPDAKRIVLHVSSAQLQTDKSTGGVVMIVQLRPDSAAAFGRFTAANVGRLIDVRSGGQSLIRPTIMAPIEGGQLSITSGVGEYASSPEEMKAVAEQLQAGTGTIEAVLLPHG